MKHLFLAFALAALSLTGASVSAHPSIDLVASNWKFTPGTITLHVGETTQLRMTSSAGVHGIESSELGIPLTTITPGKFVTVSVTPKKAGTYTLKCAIICGPTGMHDHMVLTVNVVEGK